MSFHVVTDRLTHFESMLMWHVGLTKGITEYSEIPFSKRRKIKRSDIKYDKN